jgi:hypothetical protein
MSNGDWCEGISVLPGDAEPEKIQPEFPVFEGGKKTEPVPFQDRKPKQPPWSDEKCQRLLKVFLTPGREAWLAAYPEIAWPS